MFGFYPVLVHLSNVPTSLQKFVCPAIMNLIWKNWEYRFERPRDNFIIPTISPFIFFFFFSFFNYSFTSMATKASSAEDLDIGDQNPFLHDSPEGTTQTISRRSSVKREDSQIGMMMTTGKQSDQQQDTQSQRASETSRSSFREPTVKEGLISFVTSSYINPLVIFIPFGIASHFVWPPTVTFILNFIAIVPLAKLLGFATEDIALRVGEILGGLLNASFGNAVELIISIISLTKNLVTVVQASMLGSILSNLLLVLGMCFWFGGIRFKEQNFNVTAAMTSASLLFIATISLLLPASFYASVYGTETNAQVTADILKISRATSVLLLVIYFAYLFFQVKTFGNI